MTDARNVKDGSCARASLIFIIRGKRGRKAYEIEGGNVCDNQDRIRQRGGAPEE
nr:MAG TPA: hypothetical protein [Caudoviricetes sp.]